MPGSPSLAPCPTDPGKVLVESRLISIEEKMANIESILTSKVQSQTWAQIVAEHSESTAAAGSKAQERAKRRQQQETLKEQREPYEVTLTTSNNETKNKLDNMQTREIAKRCQYVIDIGTIKKPKIN